jgi:hypothetical protein
LTDHGSLTVIIFKDPADAANGEETQTLPKPRKEL